MTAASKSESSGAERLLSSPTAEVPDAAGALPWKWRHKSASLHEQPDPSTPYQYGKTVLQADYDYDSGVSIIADDDVLALIASAPATDKAARVMLEALEAQQAAAEADAEYTDLLERGVKEGWAYEPTGGSHLISASIRCEKLHTQARELREASISLAHAAGLKTGER